MPQSRELLDAAAHLDAEWTRDERRNRKIDAYMRGAHDSVYVPRPAQQEYRWLVSRARVNILTLVVDTFAQALYVEGYRPARSADNASPWGHWQANRMDARQSGLYRAALTYGVAYLLVLPGDPAPLWMPRSPRRLTAVYDDPVDDEWPVYALERRGRVEDADRFRLYGPGSYWDVTRDNAGWRLGEERVHGFARCPVARYLDAYDLDGAVTGEVWPLITMQDQINFTTFGLLMAQHYTAFRQRWVTGMLAEDEQGRTSGFNAAVDAMFTAESPDTRFGEFGQTDLGGYLDSREASLRQAAMVSQVPPHALLGQMANLSAEALAAAEVQKTRKVDERKVILGESHEQAFRLSAAMAGDTDAAGDTAAQVVWRDTEARSLSATVDALGKLAQMLGVPPQELWERVPGVTDTDVERWKATAATNDTLGGLAAMLDRQTAALTQDGPPPV